MIGKIFAVIVVVSVISSAFTGNILLLSDAVMEGVTDAVTISISLMGMMCFWSGIMSVFEYVGVTKWLAKMLRPVMRLVYSKKVCQGKILENICCCVTANFLGLGNAALPLGIKAIKSMKERDNKTAGADMIMFAVLNTVPFQLLPATLIALRRDNGSENPFLIIVPIWICSIATIVFAVVLCKIFAFFAGNKHES